MTGEKTIPLLPCRSIDETAEFYRALGFQETLHQTRPNPYTVVEKDDIQLHFFGVDDLDPETTYGTCVVIVPDTGALFETFAAGMRAAYGKLLVSGIPRMTRPRKRANTGNRAGFSVVDPGGNTIRFFPADEDTEEPPAPTSRLGRTLARAIVLGDAKGDTAQAAKILDATLAKTPDDTPPRELAEALAYRAELAARQNDPARARDLLDRLARVPLTDDDRTSLATTLTAAADLSAQLP
ncbi:VOC family protein [Glycomyces terrestris]|uniref:VOC family protein n=1 Tax=Glycomyces terrestris TaxID=2493553 RepID=A0A426V3T1_9ACTN|nr:VOC family protein [Glycomyces terrestris]RRS01491.1 VOC family protein [Glycomyces terrestris]